MNNTLVIFGASGNLTSLKLVPALFHLFCKNRLPLPFWIVGVSRTPYTDSEWRAKLEKSTRKYLEQRFVPDKWESFSTMIHYFTGDIQQSETFSELNRYLNQFNDLSKKSLCVYYLSILPQLYPETILNLGHAGMTRESGDRQYRIIIEKPFGINRETAESLNRTAHSVFQESQIYRIDHYLGKESVNNLFVLRFANAIFEPLWNRNYIDHIQITANESVTVGQRGGFYDVTGVLRDMFQNHLLQLLTITTMEPPVRFDAKSVRDEKLKVLRSIRPMTPDMIEENTIRGQYIGYREEPQVNPASLTPTFAAVKLYIDNWRWKDVPIYLRSGKEMSCQTTQILIQYKEPPHIIFDKLYQSQNKVPTFVKNPWNVNHLLIQLQPAEGIRLSFLSKVPGTDLLLRNSELVYTFSDHYNEELPEAYQRLLLDVFSGDASLFLRDDEIETAWEIIDPIQQNWDSSKMKNKIFFYSPGSWGPDESENWIRRQNREWFNLCPVLRKNRPLNDG